MSALTENTPFDDIPGVTEVVGRIRSSLERNFPFIWVRGEVADFSRGPSGHMYFCLKDEQSRLRCIWFAGHQKEKGQKFNPLTGEVHENPVHMDKLLRNGLELVCGGKISYYAQGAACQLVVEFAQLAGVGLLAQAFEALRASLEARGLFDPQKKRKLPRNPAKVALVTSMHGAAVHDFLKIGNLRGTSSLIRLFPTPVQGEGAGQKIARAIKFINDQAWADVLVLIRGGGSQEDLWTFNEEVVAQAVHDSAIPVLTGIGHEIDRSLADLAADAAAATPTHAAQMLWPLRSELRQQLDGLYWRLEGLIRRRLESAEAGFGQKLGLLQAFSPAIQIARLEKSLDGLDRLLKSAIIAYLRDSSLRRERLFHSLRNLSPARMLDVREEKINACADKLRNALLRQAGSMAERLDRQTVRLEAALEKRLAEKTARLERLDGVLLALDPKKWLDRGFALVFQGGKLLRSIKNMDPGKSVRIRLADGEIEAKPISSKACGRMNEE